MSLGTFRKHVASHQQQLSLFALPVGLTEADEEEESDGDEVEDDVSVRDVDDSEIEEAVVTKEPADRPSGWDYDDDDDGDWVQDPTSSSEERHVYNDEHEKELDRIIRKYEEKKRQKEPKTDEDIDAERRRIIIENEIKVMNQEREAREAQQRDVDDYNVRKQKEEMERKHERERRVNEYERQQFEDPAEAKKQLEELMMQLSLDEAEDRKKDRAEFEAIIRRRKDIEEAEKTKKREEEQKLDRAMRERLAEFGYNDNQIQSMVTLEDQQKGKGLAPIPEQLDPPPTYAKIHSRYLDIETLHYYDLPYELDTTDPSNTYIIVLRENLSQRETEVLFEHTRRLKAGRKTAKQEHNARLYMEASRKQLLAEPSAKPEKETRENPTFLEEGQERGESVIAKDLANRERGVLAGPRAVQENRQKHISRGLSDSESEAW